MHWGSDDMRLALTMLIAMLLASSGWCREAPMRVKDLGKVQGWRENVL